MQTCTHADIYTCTHLHMYTFTHSHLYTCRHADMQTYALTTNCTTNHVQIGQTFTQSLADCEPRVYCWKGLNGNQQKLKVNKQRFVETKRKTYDITWLDSNKNHPRT